MQIRVGRVRTPVYVHGMAEYAISELSVAGGTIGMGRMPGRAGTYAADWATLVSWAPDMVITLTEQHELDRFGAGLLGSELKDVGVDWHHLPISDFGVPSTEGDAQWAALQPLAKGLLQRGGRVFVHCFGGCGRTGAIVLRLMVQIGEDPKDALIRLRVVRPCAIETDSQFDWAAKGPV